MLSSRNDPLVSFELGGREILLPISHDLPLILDHNPYYARNLVRLVALASASDPDLLVVDVGANVGDSAILIRESLSCPIVCIEGDPRYMHLLRGNAESLTGITAVEAFVSFQGSDQVAWSVERGGGTARLAQSPGTTGVQTTPLANLLATHAPHTAPRFLKIDTDGYDSRIIRANQNLLMTARPIVFFEFDPELMRDSGDEDYVRVFAVLEDLGYHTALVYQNTGELLAISTVGSTDFWSDLAACLLVGPAGHYIDIAVYHESDDHLANMSVHAERQFFQLVLAARS